ncbi:MAG: DUF4384 domain-containing protein [Spirochaetales bacterium]|nr:DUF4384 domain-containing protein [Spirochaetales bacterium]
MKQRIFILILIILLFAFQLLFTEQSENDNLIFRWAFLLRDDRGVLTVLNQKYPSIPLKAGDTFKIFLQPVKNAYIYLFLYDAEEELYILFPEKFKKEIKEGEHYYLPDDTNWYYIKEGVGTEKFYLIVSTSRLLEIEKLYKVYTELLAKSVSREKKYNAKHRVIEKIEILLKEKTAFSGIVELPYPVAGEWRALLDEDEFNAIEVKTEEFYAKKIRLTH